MKLSIQLILFVLNPYLCFSIDIISSFDNSDEGWRVIGDSDSFYPYYNSDKGYCYAIDVGTGDTWYWLAPEPFLGDKENLYNQKMSFDLKQSSLENQYKNDDIIITGNGVTIIYQFDFYPGLDWTHYDIYFDESFWYDTNNNNINKETLIKVLSSIESIKIRGEFVQGSDIGSIDNIVMEGGSIFADFEIENRIVEIDEFVSFTDKSISEETITEWEWDFNNDGEIDSFEKNPKYAYTAYGKYTVVLIVKTSDDYNKKIERKAVWVRPKCTLFADDFDAGHIGGEWELINGEWDVYDGQIRQLDNYYKDNLNDAVFALVGDDEWSNYEVTVDVMSKDNDYIGVVFNYVNKDNFHFVAWRSEIKSLILSKFVDGQMITLASKDTSYTKGKYMNMKLYSNNKNIEFFLDGKEIFNLENDMIYSGRVGLYCWGNDNSYWDNFNVCTLDFEPLASSVSESSRKEVFYPNPFDDILYVELKLDSQITVYDSNGVILISIDGKKGVNKLDCSNLTKGIYFISLVSVDGVVNNKLCK